MQGSTSTRRRWGTRQLLRSKGNLAESFVAEWLEKRGFRILCRNQQVGRNELDIVARKGRLLVVCEVKSRRTDRFAYPAESMSAEKISRVRQATAQWLATNEIRGVDIRFDAAAVVWEGADGKPHIEYYENAF